MLPKQRFPYLILLSIIFLSAFQFPKDDLDNIFEKINNEVNLNSKAYSTLSTACSTIGHRLTGSANGKKAEEYTFNLMKSYGFKDVKYYPFQVVAWSRDTVSLQIAPENSDDFRNVQVTALASTPVSSHMNGSLIDLGNGLEADFERVNEKVKGKVVLMNLGLVGVPKETKNLHRSEKTALAIKYGATGVIMVNQVPKNVLLTGTASITGSLIDIPAVCVSMESGQQIRSWIEENPKLLAFIEMKNHSSLIKARNIVTTIKGSKYPNEKIIIGGHLDSWDLATGAMDNGIGSFSVMDIARTFKALDIKPLRTIEFVLFMGEEQGLLGSRAMIKDYIRQQKLGSVRYMMNLDMVNNVQGFNVGGRDEMIDFTREIGEKIKKVDPSFLNTVSNRAGLHSDHQGFMIQGVPTMNPNGSFAPEALGCYHANCDNISIINEGEMKNTVKYTSMMLYALANTPDLKAKKLNSEATRQFLIDQGLKTELVIGKDWRWKN
jgi:carboxypeptidase Q